MQTRLEQDEEDEAFRQLIQQVQPELDDIRARLERAADWAQQAVESARRASNVAETAKLAETKSALVLAVTAAKKSAANALASARRGIAAKTRSQKAIETTHMAWTYAAKARDFIKEEQRAQIEMRAFKAARQAEHNKRVSITTQTTTGQQTETLTVSFSSGKRKTVDVEENKKKRHTGSTI